MLSRRLPGGTNALALALVGCAVGSSCSCEPAQERPEPADAAVDTCPRCAEPAVAGTVADPALNEVSGLSASALHTDVFYAHNDSGDAPRFFALGQSGAALGTFTVEGAKAVDWEDMARGPCPQGSCLYFADFGDNFSKRSDYVIYRVPEPSLEAGAPSALAAEAFPFRYPDGSHDAETLLVHPKTGALTIVIKVWSGASGVYELPAKLEPGEPATLAKAGEIRPPDGTFRFTGGDVHPEGRGVLLRTYTHVFFYPMRPEQSVAEALAGEPCDLPVGDEPQGEAIAWLASGKGYITVSEHAGPKVHLVSCGDP